MSTEGPNLYSVILRILILAATNLYTMIFIMCRLLKKRRSLKAFGLYVCGKIIVVNIFRCYILPYYLEENEQLHTVSTAVVWVTGILSYVLLFYTFDADFLRIAVVACGAEAVASIFGSVIQMIFNWAEGRKQLIEFAVEFQWADLGIPVLIICLLAFLRRCLSPFEEKMKHFEWKHRNILWAAVIGYFLTAVTSMLIDARKNSFDTGTIAAIYIVIGLLFIIYQIVRKYQNEARHEQQFFRTQQQLMVLHYESVYGQIRRMERSQQLIQKQMEKINSLSDGAEESQQIGDYLAELKEDYEQLQAGMYCDDWTVDAVLYSQSELFKDQGIRFECMMQGYDRGNIEEHDFTQILLLLLDFAVRANENAEDKWIQLGVSSVKNQLIIRCLCGNARRLRIPKRSFRRYLGKYSGEMKQIQSGSSVERVLILQKRGDKEWNRK